MLLGDGGRRILAFNRYANAKTRKEKADALKAIRKLEKEQINKMYRKDGTLRSQYRKTGGYTVTNRFSDIMLPGKKRTTRIT